jgi:hypothetical protein
MLREVMESSYSINPANIALTAAMMELTPVPSIYSVRVAILTLSRFSSKSQYNEKLW